MPRTCKSETNLLPFLHWLLSSNTMLHWTVTKVVQELISSVSYSAALLYSFRDPAPCSDSFRRLLKTSLFTVYETHTAWQ